MNRKKIFAVALSAVFVSAVMFLCTQEYTETLSRYGSTGNEVREIQTRLKNWGYKINKVDGIYKSETEKAVREFQKNNGIKVDGIAGPQTLMRMGINSNSTASANDNNTRLLARIINAEARGEPYAGQVAVGAVVLNRVENPAFPNTISGVIYQPGAFTAIADGQWNAEMYDTPYKAAQDALNGWDPTGGAVYYYNPAKTTNNWIYSRPVITTIGKHVFAK